MIGRAALPLLGRLVLLVPTQHLSRKQGGTGLTNGKAAYDIVRVVSFNPLSNECLISG
jgi:hypothetical protein